MRKVILYVNATLDGFMAGPAGELDWMIPDQELNPWLADLMRAEVDTMLVGRNACQAFEATFSAQAADPASPPDLVDFCRWMLDIPKVVFSRTRPELTNPSARYAEDPLVQAVTELKQQDGEALVVFGGTSVVQQLVRAGLVDEFWLKIYPFALGAGQPIFADLPARVELGLLDNRAFGSGIVVTRYALARLGRPSEL